MLKTDGAPNPIHHRTNRDWPHIPERRNCAIRPVFWEETNFPVKQRLRPDTLSFTSMQKLTQPNQGRLGKPRKKLSSNSISSSGFFPPLSGRPPQHPSDDGPSESFLWRVRVPASKVSVKQAKAAAAAATATAAARTDKK